MGFPAAAAFPLSFSDFEGRLPRLSNLGPLATCTRNPRTYFTKVPYRLLSERSWHVFFAASSSRGDGETRGSKSVGSGLTVLVSSLAIVILDLFFVLLESSIGTSNSSCNQIWVCNQA